ncbi:MAG: UDP-N-acetylmuramoyl-L-alanine--D-glutamate ligase [Deltaproteobacteria bacterium]|nr:UDP-N-acetylmuramoyl-L-alanine--D-glutamate ligase [Deltaproteobacteria bacterium]
MNFITGSAEVAARMWHAYATFGKETSFRTDTVCHMNYREKLIQIRSQNERVLIVGMGISGIETAYFLRRAGVECVCVEKSGEPEYLVSNRYRSEIEPLRKLGAEIHFGIDGEKIARFVERVSLCVLSPGVSLESAVCGTLKRFNISTISELELGVELLRRRTVVVTGSNGKSTTVSLIHAMLQASGISSSLCGNVGMPVIANAPADALESDGTDSGWLVVEASSYQLETCTVLRPDIAVLLNISDNHLERHGSIERYLAIKAKIFANQTPSDWAIFSGDDARIAGLRGSLKAQAGVFSVAPASASCNAVSTVRREKGFDSISLMLNGETESYDCRLSKLPGLHNRLNIAAAALTSRLCGASTAAVQKAIEDFHSLAHRLEVCGEKHGVVFVNDSKSTTVAASQAALQSSLDEFPESRMIVLLGGLSKAGSWESLLAAIKSAGERVRSVICFGKDARLIASNCKSKGVPHSIAGKLESAVRQAAEVAEPGDVVLLSPACASFDEFSDFEERGNVFKSLVSSI